MCIKNFIKNVHGEMHNKFGYVNRINDFKFEATFQKWHSACSCILTNICIVLLKLS